MLRFSQLVGLLTSTNRRQNPCFGQYLPLLTRLFYAWGAISFTTMAAGPVSIHFVCGETRRPAGNCFATPVLVGRDATAAIVVNEMRETAMLEICVPPNLSPRLSMFSAIAHRRSPIVDRRLTIIKFWRVFVSFTATPSLPCAFHSPIHDFQRHQEATNWHCRRLEAHFRCLVDQTVQGDERCEVDCNFRLELRRVCSCFGETQSWLCAVLVPRHSGNTSQWAAKS